MNINNEYKFLTTLYIKSAHEIKNDYNPNFSFILNALQHFIGKDIIPEKVMKTVLKKKEPLHYVLDRFNNSPLKRKYLAESKEMLNGSYMTMKGASDFSVYFYDINGKYCFYFDPSPFQGENRCYVCIFYKDTEKVVFDFNSTFEEYINDTSLIEKFALFMFMTSDEFKGVM